ncbi:MAG TPA: molecular chaperone HtpG, partial [Desulfurivibrionaceae bacterium]|nr:molecular chaperone HtpG [Desulfurivibrionaceae bacterium]
LKEYVERMPEGQKDIYYINGGSREAIEAGPYVEAFKKRGIEVLYTLEAIDDFAMNHLGEFEGKKLVSADRGDLDLPETAKSAEAEQEAEAALPGKEVKALVKWMQEVLGDRVKEVKESKRLSGSPAMIVNPDGFLTSSMERVMRASGQNVPDFGKKVLEINTSHPLLKGLNTLRASEEPLAKSVVEQIFDNAMIQAGLMVEPRTMVERTYKILARLVGSDA